MVVAARNGAAFPSRRSTRVEKSTDPRINENSRAQTDAEMHAWSTPMVR
jgi:hypothetical protein